MADVSGIVQTIGAIVASGLFTTYVARKGDRSARKTAEAETQVKAEGQQMTGEAKFREDMLRRLADSDRRHDDLSLRFDELTRLREADAREAARLREVDRMRYEDSLLKERDRFEAREDQLLRWGTWDASPPPRQPPVFTWPPRP